MYLFYEDMMRDKLAGLHRVYAHISLAPPEYPEAMLAQRVNKTRAVEFPPEVQSLLRDRFREQKTVLAERFGGLPVEWESA